jgi:hypothetical protein
MAILFALLLCLSPLEGCWRRPRPEAPNPHIEMLKSWVPPATLKDVPRDFWTYDGFRDWWRFPLAYPYQMTSIDSLDYAGTLGRFNGKAAVSASNESNDQLIPHLTHIAFDRNVLIGRISAGTSLDTPTAPAKCWVVFEFATGKSEEFASEAAAVAAAKDCGFSGDAELLSIKDQYSKCFK